jgi:hypothetical protein
MVQLSIAKLILDSYALTIDPSKIAQTLSKGIQQRFDRGGGCAREKAYSGGVFGRLLRE